MKIQSHKAILDAQYSKESFHFGMIQDGTRATPNLFSKEASQFNRKNLQKSQNSSGFSQIDLSQNRTEFHKKVIVKTLSQLKLAQNKETNLYSAHEDSFSERGSILDIKQDIPVNTPQKKVFLKTQDFASTKLNFSAKAIVKTEDKEISVDLNFSLSRKKFSEKNLAIAFTDPLVINYEKNLTELSEEKFSFDIDNDGLEDQISMLKRGSGFLALDRNNNNKIDNGKELFGTEKGNGFDELREFDEDGNGWIDSNDPIFDKLRIWAKNSGGEGKLLALTEVGIGGIYLGDIDTKFILDGENQALGQMTHTSFFLKENGHAGLIHNIDLAVIKGEKKEKEPEKSLDELYKPMDDEEFFQDLSQYQIIGEKINYKHQQEKLDESKAAHISKTEERARQELSSLKRKHRLSVDSDERKKLDTQMTILKNQISIIEGSGLG